MVELYPLLPRSLAGPSGVELEFANSAGLIIEGVETLVAEQAFDRAERVEKSAVDPASRLTVVAYDGAAVSEGAEFGETPAPSVQTGDEIDARLVGSLLDRGVVAGRRR